MEQRELKVKDVPTPGISEDTRSLLRKVKRITCLLLVLLPSLLALSCSPAPATAGTITEFPIPTASSQPEGITSGPDQALWFTEAQGNKIGRITTSGSITEFALPTTASNPQGITLGPDQALWFTEFAGNKIGRITTGGSITEFALPTTQC